MALAAARAACSTLKSTLRSCVTCSTRAFTARLRAVMRCCRARRTRASSVEENSSTPAVALRGAWYAHALVLCSRCASLWNSPLAGSTPLRPTPTRANVSANAGVELVRVTRVSGDFSLAAEAFCSLPSGGSYRRLRILRSRRAIRSPASSSVPNPPSPALKRSEGHVLGRSVWRRSGIKASRQSGWLLLRAEAQASVESSPAACCASVSSSSDWSFRRCS
mmetsp:Transcript_24977/g.79528  ORF Transcript_24977/g.79528 Transcript_24977/m.79528 type:complete len:221 (-) Transcript_24977:515-1177(-)